MTGVPGERSVWPALLVSVALHAALWLVVPRGGPPVLGPPAAPSQPMLWVDVSEVAAMPGTGDDLLAGPAGIPGGSPFGVPGGPPAPEGVDPLAVIPRSALAELAELERLAREAPAGPDGKPVFVPGDGQVAWDGAAPTAADGVPSTAGGAPGDAELDRIRVLDGVSGGVPIPPPGAGEAPAGDVAGTPGAISREAAALRAAALRELLESGAPIVDDIGFGSPSGLGGEGVFSGAGHRLGTITDPEILFWQRQVRAKMKDAFHPLPAVVKAHPELAVRVRVTLDPVTGVITGRELLDSSGVLSFDQAALRAVDDVATLPPPPERWRDVVAQGLELRFVP